MNLQEWLRKALAAGEDLARDGAGFAADELIALVGYPDAEHNHNSANSAIGSVFRILHARGVIEPTGEVRQSRQPLRHGGLVRVWRGTKQPTLF